jgi:signal transduction histidine kinase
MKPAPLPPNENDRLSALKNYEILDTPPEPEFDALTELASAICGTPIALISLVDRDRQWFKSKVGLAASETSRDVSFCGHALLETEIFIVEDAQQDERFKDNPLVTGAPSIRFYAGAQLRNDTGHAIGTLCVIDTQPRTLSNEKRKALQTLSHMVISQLELKKKNTELQAALETIEAQKLTLLYHSKMSALGEMAGGIAHEINNPLAIISGYADRLRFLFRPHSPLPEFEKIDSILKGIFKGVDRVSSIVKGLQLFSRDSSRDPLSVSDLRSVIHESLGLCQESFKVLGIEIRYQEPATEILVFCRPSQISQILVNLLNNAKDAVKDLNGSRWVEIGLTQDSETTDLYVWDSGPGIPDELRDKIFLPFFTTKDPGKGTGLGLSVSKSLATSNDAILELEEQKHPSRFSLKFKTKKSRGGRE